jgi:hypothetical protein
LNALPVEALVLSILQRIPTPVVMNSYAILIVPWLANRPTATHDDPFVIQEIIYGTVLYDLTDVFS